VLRHARKLQLLGVQAFKINKCRNIMRISNIQTHPSLIANESMDQLLRERMPMRREKRERKEETETMTFVPSALYATGEYYQHKKSYAE
jgi:hypothetical protein